MENQIKKIFPVRLINIHQIIVFVNTFLIIEGLKIYNISSISDFILMIRL